jgi:hypothetical protein
MTSGRCTSSNRGNCLGFLHSTVSKRIMIPIQ